MILCDVCDGGYHLYCADPKLKKVPAGDWICQDCVASKTGKKRRRRRSQTSVAAAGSSSSNGKAALNGKVKTEHGGVSMMASEDTGQGGEGIGNGSDAQNPWDLVECQECGSAEGEERMILCDMCGESDVLCSSLRDVRSQSFFLCRPCIVASGLGIFVVPPRSHVACLTACTTLFLELQGLATPCESFRTSERMIDLLKRC